MVDDPAFEHYLNRPYTEAIIHLVQKYQPEVFLIGATTLGRDLAGAVATSIKTGLTADCTKLEMGPIPAGYPSSLRRQRHRNHCL